MQNWRARVSERPATITRGRANTVVSKRELLAAIWGKDVADDGTLRAQVANLRRVLGDGQAGARYIVTVAGRGYSFIAPVSRSARGERTTSHRAATLPRSAGVSMGWRWRWN